MTDIKTNSTNERLAISLEDNEVILLYVPDTNKSRHYHISLSNPLQLRDWINENIKWNI